MKNDSRIEKLKFDNYHSEYIFMISFNAELCLFNNEKMVFEEKIVPLL